MQIERTENEIIIRLTSSISEKDLEELIDRINQLENSRIEAASDQGEDDQPFASKNGLSFSDFSFSKSRKALENYKGSFSDAVIEERRADL